MQSIMSMTTFFMPMPILGASLISLSLAAAVTYFAIGLVFALLFSWKWVIRFDPVADGSSWGFRLLVIPGAAALWPILLPRTVRGGSA